MSVVVVVLFVTDRGRERVEPGERGQGAVVTDCEGMDGVEGGLVGPVLGVRRRFVLGFELGLTDADADGGD